MNERSRSSIVDIASDRVSRTARTVTQRAIPAETPVAMTYNSNTYAVMMASPCDLEDFAVGFSLSERIIKNAKEITELEIVTLDRGIELRMSLAESRRDELESRRRKLAGPAGCGLCGIESLDAAVAMPQPVSVDLKVAPETIFRALESLQMHQQMNTRTRAVHGAGYWRLAENRFIAVCEDVGRHNALDKLIGSLGRRGLDAANGFIIMTSRISIELVQKAVSAGCPLLIAVSVPTAFAVEAAEKLNLTMVAVARNDAFEIFTHPHRISDA